MKIEFLETKILNITWTAIINHPKLWFLRAFLDNTLSLITNIQ